MRMYFQIISEITDIEIIARAERSVTSVASARNTVRAAGVSSRAGLQSN